MEQKLRWYVGYSHIGLWKMATHPPQFRETREAYQTIKSHARKFVDNVDLISVDAFNLDGENSEEVITRASSLELTRHDLQS